MHSTASLHTVLRARKSDDDVPLVWRQIAPKIDGRAWNPYVRKDKRKYRGIRDKSEGVTLTLSEATHDHQRYIQYGLKRDTSYEHNPIVRFARDTHQAELLSWIETHKKRLGARLRVTPAFINGKGSYVTKTHQDDYQNILAVLRGRKTFHLAHPLESHPDEARRVKHRNRGYPSEAPDDTPTTRHFNYKVTLHAGDVLYIPRDWWHYVVTTQPSCMINLWYDADG